MIGRELKSSAYAISLKAAIDLNLFFDSDGLKQFPAAAALILRIAAIY
jgi:hypothetical protein